MTKTNDQVSVTATRVRAWVRWIALHVLPSALAFAMLFRLVSAGSVWSALTQAHFIRFVPALLVLLLGASCLEFRWIAALRAVGIAPPSAIRAVLLTLRAQAALPLLPGEVGTDVLRIAEAGYDKQMIRSLSAVALAERLAGGTLLAALALASLGLLLLDRTTSLVLLGALIASFPTTTVRSLS